MHKDIYYVAEQLYEVGCEAINLDTAASAGDPEFWGSLLVVEDIKAKISRLLDITIRSVELYMQHLAT